MHSEWFDERGWMNPFGENGSLFTTEYCFLFYKEFGTKRKDLASKAISNFTDGEKITYGDEKGTWSHDNHTGFVCLSKLMGFDYHKKFFWTGWYRRAHPRDWIFYWYLKGGLASVIAWFFLWIPSLAMIISCAENYKVRNGVKILKTDGKLLAWLRLHTVNMPITKFLCSYFLKKDLEFGSWYKCFKIYFGTPGHPNANFKKAIYEDIRKIV